MQLNKQTNKHKKNKQKYTIAKNNTTFTRRRSSIKIKLTSRKEIAKPKTNNNNKIIKFI